jgi:hypothetical protein
VTTLQGYSHRNSLVMIRLAPELFSNLATLSALTPGQQPRRDGRSD